MSGLMTDVDYCIGKRGRTRRRSSAIKASGVDIAQGQIDRDRYVGRRPRN